MPTCPYCSRRNLPDHGAAFSHILAKHSRKLANAYRAENPRAEDDEPSMASLFVQAEINRAMGIPNEDWIEASLP